MSATDQMRAMLAELMGTDQEGGSDRHALKFDHPSVCKSFLLDCCPHDILQSTRMDLGECAKVHDLALRADYNNAKGNRDYYYDIDAMEHLESFIHDCDRKVEVQKRKLKETQEELSEEASSKVEAIHGLGEQIGIALSQAEEMAGKGDVEASMKLMEKVEELKKAKNEAENDYRNSMPASSYQQQKLRVCEVCCAYLGIHDNDRRLADHFGGKLHLGFIEIREKLLNLQKSVADRRTQRERERDEARRRRSTSRSARRSRSRSRSRRRSRSRSRSRRGHKRSSRSRSRSKKHRPRSRDHKRSRSRSRSSRKQRSRSRSKTHKKRSGSRSKRSKRSRSRERSRRSKRSRTPKSKSQSPVKENEKDEAANNEWNGGFESGEASDQNSS